jgi:hypothetical protein
MRNPFCGLRVASASELCTPYPLHMLLRQPSFYLSTPFGSPEQQHNTNKNTVCRNPIWSRRVTPSSKLCSPYPLHTVMQPSNSDVMDSGSSLPYQLPSADSLDAPHPCSPCSSNGQQMDGTSVPCHFPSLHVTGAHNLNLLRPPSPTETSFQSISCCFQVRWDPPPDTTPPPPAPPPLSPSSGAWDAHQGFGYRRNTRLCMPCQHTWV